VHLCSLHTYQLYALDTATGTLKGFIQLNQQPESGPFPLSPSVAVDAQGTVYVAAASPDFPKVRATALSADIPFPPVPLKSCKNMQSCGRVCVQVYALSLGPAGFQTLWSVPLNPTYGFDSVRATPLVGPDQTLYTVTYAGMALSAFQGPHANSGSM
jgi:hypothetical protein